MSALSNPSASKESTLLAGIKQSPFLPVRRLETEWLDEPGHSRETLAGNFRDIAFLNRWFGGLSPVDKSLRPFLSVERPVAFTILDLAAGGADVPLALARRWRKQGIKLAITALDIDPAITELAMEAAHRENLEEFRAITADVFTYPYPEDREYDFVTCSLAFHHFSPELCVEMLRLMSNLAGRAFVVNDLRRGWFGWFGSKLLTLLVARHPFTRHDGPLSVLRSYTIKEMEALVRAAQLDPTWKVRVRRGPFSRLVIVGENQEALNKGA
ncbi:MAG: methyltransferase domain-containing protein [Chloroflexi bacterium]|mgnify:CR=1 FL=1|nr:methyltransferase domain-containing protein [Chloroflexota bacterium]OJW06820.1 MAG: hypothetical protein BGO39_23800 [Chloroflexi bacterium 54-19]